MIISEQFESMRRQFEEVFGGCEPGWAVCAPGRINLIGEHTDYNGFPVLPMAIGRAVRMLVAPRRDGTVLLRNADSRWGPREFSLGRRIPPFASGDWGNYAKAAAQSLARLAADRGMELSGMLCFVSGDIPVEAGLSSSTALVVATALALAQVNQLEVEPEELAERMAEAEHYVGTRGGGMDQAVCLLAEPNRAVKVDFFPLRARRVDFPSEHCVVAAHSTVCAKKTGHRRRAYNLRVLECCTGVHILARRLGISPPERLAGLCEEASPERLRELTGLLREATGGRESLTLERTAELCGLEPDQYVEEVVSNAGLDRPPEALHALPRCRHVFSEAARTEEAAERLERGEVEEVGRLMDESHRSCARDYAISCRELDRLVEIMREAGALGARLTGAGFGGFAIGLARAGRVSAIRRALTERFYHSERKETEGHVFAFRPAAGAAVESLK